MMSLLDILRDKSIEPNQKVYFDVTLSENGQQYLATDDGTQSGDDCLTVEIQKAQVNFSN